MPGVGVVAVSPGGPLYTRRRPARDRPAAALRPRRAGAPARHGRCYDAVHICSFPYFSLLAARAGAARGALPARGRLVRGLDTRRTGAGTSGRAGGRIGCAGPALCARDPAAGVLLLARARASGCTSRGAAGEPTVLAGLYAEAALDAERARATSEPLVVFAGRHIPEKRARLLPARSRWRASGARACARWSSATGRSAGGCWRRSRRRRRGRASTAPGFVDRRGGRRRRCGRALACCCRRCARATGWW